MGARRIAVGLAAVLALAGCNAGNGGADDAATVPAVAATPEAAATPVATGTAAESGDEPALDGVAFLEPGEVAAAEPATEVPLTVTSVRLGQHDGYDRAVFDIAGDGTPGWDVRYVDEAVEDATGRVLDLEGDGTVQVILTGMGYPTDTGFEEWTGRQVATEGYPQLWEMRFVGTFEGQTQAFLGVSGADAAFRVFALADPVRVVVDVRH
jgi:hypothetical protein